ncbi:MAG: tetratricopeptide repeat protein [Kofleriaceae bacterium]|nr:tetratricopeptide repeat protein [Kofleriaceae bacterium]
MGPGSATIRALVTITLSAGATLAAAPAAAAPRRTPRPIRVPTTVAVPALKPVPAPYPLAALRLLLKAEMELERGELDAAEQALQSALQMAPHADVVFNLAVVHERQRNLQEAIATFRRYLTEAPSAPDRALVERHLEDLSVRSPRLLYIGRRQAVDGVAQDPDAVLIIDGTRVVPAPAEVLLDGEMHVVSHVSASTYGVDFVRGAPGAWNRPLRVGIEARAAEGNVVIQTTPYGRRSSFTTDGQAMLAGQPFKLGRGRYRIAEFGLCQPISFDVRDPTELTYVLLRFPENRGLDLNDNYHRPDGNPDNCVEVSTTIVRTRIPGRR